MDKCTFIQNLKRAQKELSENQIYEKEIITQLLFLMFGSEEIPKQFILDDIIMDSDEIKVFLEKLGLSIKSISIDTLKSFINSALYFSVELN